MNTIPAPKPRRSFFRWLAWLLLVLSLALNAVLLYRAFGGPASAVDERFHSGKPLARDKIAVVRLEGVIFEGLTSYAQKQIEQAAKDDAVKAVVLRINSPGGSITASDDLHRRLTELRDGNPAKKTRAKPLVVSMASLAASGGYYVAAPAKTLFAERTTLTGSIGVFAAFPNVTELADKYGVRMDIIKAGAVKDSGSMFHTMTPQERQLWQDLVDHSYRRFIAVVEEGRPRLKGKMLEPVYERMIPARDTRGDVLHDKDGKEKLVKYERQRADGGIFTADQAKELGLIDQVGTLEDALAEAKALAGLDDEARVVTYDRPATLMNTLFGIDLGSPDGRLDTSRLAAGTVPRLWYLAPQCEAAGFLGAVSAGANPF